MLRETAAEVDEMLQGLGVLVITLTLVIATITTFI